MTELDRAAFDHLVLDLLKDLVRAHHDMQTSLIALRAALRVLGVTNEAMAAYEVEARTFLDLPAQTPTHLEAQLQALLRACSASIQ